MNFIHLIFWLARFFIQFSVEILPHLAHELFWLLYFFSSLLFLSLVAVDVVIDGYCRLISIPKREHNSRFLFFSVSSFASSAIWYADKYHLDDVITLFISCVMWVIIWFCLSSIWLLLIRSTTWLLFFFFFFFSSSFQKPNGMRYHCVYFMSFFFSVPLVKLTI